MVKIPDGDTVELGLSEEKVESEVHDPSNDTSIESHGGGGIESGRPTDERSLSESLLQSSSMSPLLGTSLVVCAESVQKTSCSHNDESTGTGTAT